MAAPRPLTFTPPGGCSIRSLYPAPAGAYLAILLDCAFGPLTLIADLISGQVGNPLQEPLDTRFLAWNADGRGLYLLADALGEARLLHVNLQSGRIARLPLPDSTYAVACSPDSQTLAYAQTRGIGFGSQMFLGDLNGRQARLILSEPEHIIALPRWSSDGRYLAYIRMPDTQAQFPPGELWLLDMAAGTRRFLAEADAGRGYAPAWSPNKQLIAFAGPGQQEDKAGNLNSAIHVLDVESGQEFDVSRPINGKAGAPVWSPYGRLIVFPVALDGKMSLWAYDMSAQSAIMLEETGVCCPAWIGK